MPVIKFTMDDFEFDLAMARLPLATIPDGIPPPRTNHFLGPHPKTPKP